MRVATSTGQAVRCGGPRCIRDVAGLDHHLRRLDARRQRTLRQLEAQVLRRAADARCDCQDAEPVAPATRAPRRVQGDWLIGALRLSEDVARAIAGQEILADEEAWGALQASLSTRQAWTTTRRKVAKRRAAIWSTSNATPAQRDKIREDGVRVNGSTVGGVALNGTLSAPCECGEVYSAGTIWSSGARYVDALFGDDANPGTARLIRDPATGSYRLTVSPWRSLRRVEHWLNVELWEGRSRSLGACVEGAEVYLRRGRTWDGSEEPSTATSAWVDAPDDPFDWAAPEANEFGDTPILSIRDFRATEAGPLVISCYPPLATSGGGSDIVGGLPLIDGVEGSVYGAVLGDDREGILFLDCCHVYVSNLRIRGFEIGLNTRIRSKHHLYQNLTVYDCVGAGISFGSGEDAATWFYGFDPSMVNDPNMVGTLDQMFDQMGEDGFYVEDIIVDTCNLYSIGYDTGGQDIGIGFMATNCTVTGCTLTGDEVRGVDGIIFNGASSGHLIEKNRISGHGKFCRVTDTYKAGFVLRPTGTTLVHPCSDLSPGGVLATTPVDTPYGYAVQYDPVAPTPENRSAFGEHGIDLKNVRKRTPTANDETHICDNVIWGHPIFGGIAVSNHSQNIHIYRNRIFQNADGIIISGEPSNGWYNYGTYYERDVSQVYIYRNLIYMNTQRGIHIKSNTGTVTAGQDTSVSTTFEIRGVYLVGNTIAHNLWEGVHMEIDDDAAGISGVYLFNNLLARNGYLLDGQQIQWDATTTPNSWQFWSDYNGYLGWDDSSESAPTTKVIRVGGGDGTVSDAYTSWGIEEHGVQPTFLRGLDLDAEVEIEGIEGTDTTTGDTKWGGLLVGNVQNGLPSTIEALNYDIGVRSSCSDGGISDPTTAGLNPKVVAIIRTISVVPDLEQVPTLATGVDIGAYNGPPGTGDSPGK